MNFEYIKIKRFKKQIFVVFDYIQIKFWKSFIILVYDFFSINYWILNIKTKKFKKQIFITKQFSIIFKANFENRYIKEISIFPILKVSSLFYSPHDFLSFTVFYRYFIKNKNVNFHKFSRRRFKFHRIFLFHIFASFHARIYATEFMHESVKSNVGI